MCGKVYENFIRKFLPPKLTKRMKICDMCKKEVQNFSQWGLGVYTKENNSPKRADVCTECMERILSDLPNPTPHE